MMIDDEWPALWDLRDPSAPLAPLELLDFLARPRVTRTHDALELAYGRLPMGGVWDATLDHELLAVTYKVVDAIGGTTAYGAHFGPRRLGLVPGTRLEDPVIIEKNGEIAVTLPLR